MLRWEWNEKIGEVEMVEFDKDNTPHHFTLDLYQGNAYLIIIHNYKDEDGTDMYNMVGFFLDKYHAKNCLGLNKKEGYTENIYNKKWSKWTKVTLNKRKYRYTKELVGMLTEAFDTIDIQIYSEEENE